MVINHGQIREIRLIISFPGIKAAQDYWEES